MDFNTRINEYREDQNNVSSPIWIRFIKSGSKATCALCNSSMPQKNGSTGSLVNHLKRHHGFKNVTQTNVWAQFEELSALKDERLKRKRKPESSDEPPKKQMQLSDCANQKYNRDDPRQMKRVNSIAMMLCADAQPTNMVNRPGFKHAVETLDPRFSHFLVILIKT